MLQVTRFQPLVEDLRMGRLGELRIFRPRILSFRSGLAGLSPQGVGLCLSNEIDQLVIRMSHGLKRPYFIVFLDFPNLGLDHCLQYHMGILTRFRIRSFENEELRQCGTQAVFKIQRSVLSCDRYAFSEPYGENFCFHENGIKIFEVFRVRLLTNARPIPERNPKRLL